VDMYKHHKVATPTTKIIHGKTNRKTSIINNFRNNNFRLDNRTHNGTNNSTNRIDIK